MGEYAAVFPLFVRIGKVEKTSSHSKALRRRLLLERICVPSHPHPHLKLAEIVLVQLLEAFGRNYSLSWAVLAADVNDWQQELRYVVSRMSVQIVDLSTVCFANVGCL